MISGFFWEPTWQYCTCGLNHTAFFLLLGEEMHTVAQIEFTLVLECFYVRHLIPCFFGMLNLNVML